MVWSVIKEWYIRNFVVPESMKVPKKEVRKVSIRKARILKKSKRWQKKKVKY